MLPAHCDPAKAATSRLSRDWRLWMEHHREARDDRRAPGHKHPLTEDLAHDRPSAPRDPRSVVRFRQDRADRIRPGAGRPRRRTGLDRRHREGDRRGRAEGQGRLRPHRLSRDDGRPGQDAASQGAWRPARDPRQQGTCRGDEGARHRADRSAGGQPLSVRGDRRQRRRLTRTASRISTSAAPR